MTPVELVQAQYDAYNRQDVEALRGFYAEDCVVTSLTGDLAYPSRDTFLERLAVTFAANPQNRAWPVSRICAGAMVIDHEIGHRAPGGEEFSVVSIYTVRDHRIVRLAMGRPD